MQLNQPQPLCEKAICRHCATRESCDLDRRPTGLKLSNAWPKRSPSQRIYTGFVGEETVAPICRFRLDSSVRSQQQLLARAPLFFLRTNFPNLRTDLFSSGIP